MNILFVCTGNICRSPMAEGYLNFLCKTSGKNHSIKSAGVYTENDLPASRNAVFTMKEFNVDISKHKSRKISLDIFNSSDLIIAMTKSHKNVLNSLYPLNSHKIVLLHKFDDISEKDVADPYGGDLSTYRACFEDMKKALDNLFLDIAKL